MAELILRWNFSGFYENFYYTSTSFKIPSHSWPPMKRLNRGKSSRSSVYRVLYKWTRRTNLAQVNVNGASGIALDAVINKLRYFFLRTVRPCMSMWLCLLAYWWLGRTSTLSPLYRACTSRLGTCYELTNSMPQPSWEANSALDSQDMPACIEPIRFITILLAACDYYSPGWTNPHCMLFV